MRLEIPANPVLAERARRISNAAPRGSMRRKSYGCAAIALGESTSVAAARKILSLLWQQDVRAAALQAITDVATAPEETTAP